MVLHKIPPYSTAINMNQKVLCLEVTCLVGANVPSSWDEGYFPPKQKQQGSWISMGNFPQKITLGLTCFGWWILESLLRPERIKKDRGKMEDKVWGEDCYTQPS